MILLYFTVTSIDILHILHAVHIKYIYSAVWTVNEFLDDNRYPFIILVSIDLHNLLSFPKGYVSTKTSLKVQTVHSTYHVSVDGAVEFVVVEVIYFQTTYLNFFIFQ